MKSQTIIRKKIRWVLLGLFPAIFYLLINSCGNTTTPKTDVELGQDLYMAYCNFCHGNHGDSPIADMLNVQPPDLTLISKRRNGVFPDEEIYKIIDGEEAVKAGHGDRDMPIWGETFANSERIDEVMVPKKIYQLIEYLKSIQK
jgi:mono/diheme cytochrome c family protein